jgi:phosphoribosylaminoimidazolecarboxamide formyltransferase/IMP cyclohydrolase
MPLTWWQSTFTFEQTISKADVTLEEAIENIDIGGVTLIRAAAKNHERVALVCDPLDYLDVLAELRSGEVREETRRRLAVKGFAQTAAYDQAITAYLRGLLSEEEEPALPFSLNFYPVSKLRYGENPHQEARLYGYVPDAGPLGGKLLQGKALPNNLLDLMPPGGQQSHSTDRRYASSSTFLPAEWPRQTRWQKHFRQHFVRTRSLLLEG